MHIEAENPFGLVKFENGKKQVFEAGVTHISYNYSILVHSITKSKQLINKNIENNIPESVHPDQSH